MGVFGHETAQIWPIFTQKRLFLLLFDAFCYFLMLFLMLFWGFVTFSEPFVTFLGPELV